VSLDQTLSIMQSRGDTPGSAPYLFVLLEADRPLEGGSRHLLSGIREVTIGRGTARTVERSGDRLVLRFPDRRMSSMHARLELGPMVMLFDPGSKNGSFVGDRRVDQHPLRDGDLLQLGHTFFLYRSALPEVSGEPDASSATPGDRPPGLATLSPTWALQAEQVRRVAASPVPVLVQGETGTGKELVARAIHELSCRKGALVAVNCGALPEALVESELFGYRKGAFSGALEDRPGLVRSADGGTLFLDEIGDMPLPSQVALLRVLQEGEVMAVGATKPTRVDLRVVAATHHKVGDLVASGKFREDLMARLCGFVVEVPPLRQRREDLGMLVAAVLPRAAGARASRITLSMNAARALLLYRWPLNVRELERALEAASVLTSDGVIQREHLPASVGGDAPAADRAPADLGPEDAALRAKLLLLLEQHAGNISAVAREMGKARVQIRRWIKRFEIAVVDEEED